MIYGRTIYTFYALPYRQSDNVRAIFSSNYYRDSFLDEYEIEKIELDQDERGQFNPKQTTFRLVPTSKARHSPRIEDAIKSYPRINYMRVARFFGEKTDAGQYAEEFFYFVDNVTLLPVPASNAVKYGAVTASNGAQSWTTGSRLTELQKTPAFMLDITLDPFMTYIAPDDDVPRLGFERHVALKKDTIVEQLSKSPYTQNALPACATYPYEIPKESMTKIVQRKSVYELDELQKEPCFVGIFSTSKKDWSQVVAYCPLKFKSYYPYEERRLDEEFLRRLLKTTNLWKAPVWGNFKTIDAEDADRSENEDAMREADIEYEYLGNVQLIRAYIVPRGFLQPPHISATIKHRPTLPDFPDSNILVDREVFQGAMSGEEGIPVGGRDGLILLATDQSKSYGFTPTYIEQGDGGAIFDGDLYAPPLRFMDVGTATKRIQIPQNKGERGVGTTFYTTSGAYKTGFNLIIKTGTQSIDVGGDFEIAVPFNEGQAEAQRNKWSYALQGVSTIGATVGAIATGNPLAITGSVISAGQYLARLKENRENPATIQGQGNGEFLFASSWATDQSEDQPTQMIYVGMIPATEQEIKSAEKWGYVYEGATADEIAPNILNPTAFDFPDRTPENERVFIKTANASIYGLTDAPSIPTDARQEIERILDAGVALVYDPTDDTHFR